jgi:type I restriction enzyme S subunit
MSNWNSARLSDIAEVIDSLHKTPKYTEDFDGYSMVRVTDINTRDLDLTNTKKVSLETYLEFSKKHKSKIGDIVFSRVGSYGRSSIVVTDQEFCLGQNTVFIIPQIDSYYFYYYLNSPVAREQIDSLVAGTTQPTVSLKSIKSIVVPVPPVNEQKRIVAILDQAFADIDKARATAERNLKNARELFDSYLQQVFSYEGESGKVAKLEELVTKDCSLSYGIVQPGLEIDGGLPVVRPTDLTSETIQINGLKRINPTLAESYKRTTLQGGELLLCVRGSTGVISVAASELKGANVTRGIVPIRLASEHMMQKFGYYQFISKKVQEQIREKTYGAALMQINIRDVKKLEFAVPPSSYQNDAIAKLDEMTLLVDRLKNVYQDKLNNLSELKKSILQKAFTGELTKSKGIAA